MKTILSLIIILTNIVVLVGCKNKVIDTNLEVDTKKIYYVNKSETKLVSEDYIPVADTAEELIEEYLQVMDTEPKDSSNKKAKPDNILIKNYNLKDGQLSIYFDSGYLAMQKTTEVLCRAAIVKTLTQIEEVTYVEFYVNEHPLMDSNEKPVGLMGNDKFIEDTARGVTYQNTYVTLFFANEKGTALIENIFIAPYDGNISMEQLVIEKLINPGVDFVNRTIPDGTQLIKIAVKDGVCYVDFNEKFLDKTNVIESVTIYSVVNTLAELSTINKVQFTINGEKKKYFRDGKTVFDGFFERNLDIVESDIKK